MTIRLRESSVLLSTEPAVIKGEHLLPNPWNPNRMTANMYAKALEAIQLYGFVDPITCRELDKFFQIIDGEHRWRAGTDLGMTEFPCVIVKGLDDAGAKKLTIVMNELHGQADPGKLGDLLDEIRQATSLDDLLKGLPFDEGLLGKMLKLPNLPPLPPAPVSPPPGQAPAGEPWAERVFRMPKSVALVIDEAVEKAKDGEEIETWQALERVAADYLAS